MRRVHTKENMITNEGIRVCVDESDEGGDVTCAAIDESEEGGEVTCDESEEGGIVSDAGVGESEEGGTGVGVGNSDSEEGGNVTGVGISEGEEGGVVSGVGVGESGEGGNVTVQVGGSDGGEQSGGSSMNSAVLSGDFGKVVKLKASRRLTDHEKYYLFENYYVPSEVHAFLPREIGGKQRRFQRSWLKRYKGLVYSPTENGGYCKYCVLFATPKPNVSELGVLVSKPLTNFKKVTEKLKHFSGNGRTYHKAAVEKAMALLDVMSGKSASIDVQLSTNRAQTIAANRLKLKSIAEAILFCGRQGIPLRGHRDDGPVIQDSEKLSQTTENRGNFHALLGFCVSAGDDILKQHLENAPKNAKYTSKEIQNELIGVCGDIILSKILSRIQGDLTFYSILVDEATDSANVEQLSISIHFLDSDSNSTQEKFLAFLDCHSGITGEAIAQKILQQLTTWQLDPNLLRGQGYDGAGSMAGKTKGVAAIIQAKYPRAMYIHCSAHRLNLCVVKCCKIQTVHNMMQNTDAVTRFFNNSPKRQAELERWIGDITLGERKKKLKDLCRTRWVERHEAFEVFADLFIVIVSYLEEISSAGTGWNRDTNSDAQLALSPFSFIVALLTTQDVLSYTKGLSIKLQGRSMDVVKAHHAIEEVKSTLRHARRTIDTFHDHIYQQALMVASSVGIEESIPRLASRQRQTTSDGTQLSICAYYRVSLTIPLLDHLVSQLDSRFNVESSSKIVQLMQLLLAEVCTLSSISDLTYALRCIIDYYDSDLSSRISIEPEIERWVHKWSLEPEAAKECDTPEKALRLCDPDFFPNVRTMFKVMATLLVTSCECERSISLLKHVKTSLRSSMGQDRLNGLALLYYH